MWRGRSAAGVVSERGERSTGSSRTALLPALPQHLHGKNNKEL